MPTVSALEFQRKSGRFQNEARREPVETTRHGRRESLPMSAEHHDWPRASAQRSHRADASTDLVIDAVERAEMEVGHEPLDDLLKSHRNASASRPKPGLVVRCDDFRSPLGQDHAICQESCPGIDVPVGLRCLVQGLIAFADGMTIHHRSASGAPVQAV